MHFSNSNTLRLNLIHIVNNINKKIGVLPKKLKKLEGYNSNKYKSNKY